VVLSAAQLMLSRYGYQALVAQSAAEALRFLEPWPAQPIDLAIIDIVMPNIDGFELADRIREMRPELPILFMSGYARSPRLRLDKIASQPLLSKPFSSVNLISTIRTILDARKQHSSGASE